MIRNITAGLDVGTHTTRVVVCEQSGTDTMPRVLGVGSAPTRGMRHGYITNVAHCKDSIKHALDDATRTSGVSVRRVTVGFGGITLSCETSLGSSVSTKADGEITPFDLKKAIDDAEGNISLTNKRILETFTVQHKLDGKILLGSPIGMKGVKLEVKVIFITALTQHIETLINAVSDVGLDIIDLLPSPIAGHQIHLSEKARTAGCVLINIGAETTSIAVYEDLLLSSVAVFPIGGNDITNDIALVLKIPLEEAEGIKIGSMMSNFPKRKLDEIVEARLGDMFELIDTHLKKLRRNALLPAGAVFIGGSSQFSNLQEYARIALKLPCRSGVDMLVEVSKGKLRDSVWSTAYGLALMQRESSLGHAGTSLKQTIQQFFINIGKQLLP